MRFAFLLLFFVLPPAAFVGAQPFRCSPIATAQNYKIPLSRVSRPTAPLIGKGSTTQMTLLSEDEAAQIQKWAAQHPEIPWRHAEFGCNVRAYKLNRLLEDQGIVSAKIFAEVAKTESKDRLYVVNPYVDAQKTETVFHVAAVIMVKNKKGLAQPYIIDATMFPDRMVTLEEWVQTLKKHKPTMNVETFFANRFQLTSDNPNLQNYPEMYEQNVKMNLEKMMPVHQQRLKSTR